MEDIETVTITREEHKNLLFRRQQIEQINVIIMELENGEIDGFDFGEKVLDIL